MKTIDFFEYRKELTNEDIIEHARVVAQASEEITEIEEAKKRLRGLREKIERHLKYIQEGKIQLQTQGEFEWHEPVQNAVTISPVHPGDFKPFVRDMTPEEIQEHSQLEIPFEAQDNIEFTWKVTDDEINDLIARIGTPAANDEDEPTEEELTEYFPDETITDEAEQTQPEEELRIDVDGGQYPIYLVRRKGDDHNAIYYHGELESAKRFIELYPIHKDAEKVIEIIGLEKLSARKSKEEETEQIYPAERTKWNPEDHDQKVKQLVEMEPMDVPPSIQEHSDEMEEVEKPKKRKQRLKAFLNPEQEKAWLLENVTYPQIEPLVDWVEPKRYIVNHMNSNGDVKLKWYKEAIYEVEHFGRNRKCVKLIDVFQSFAEARDRCNALNLQDKLAAGEDDRELSEIFGDPEPKEVKHGYYHFIEPSGNKLYPWKIRQEVWSKDRLIESIGIHWAATEEEAKEKLESLKEVERVSRKKD